MIDTNDTTDLALKFGAIVHDARTLTCLLHRITGRYLAADDADMHEALNLAELIEGTADAGMQVLPEPAPAAQLRDHVPGPDGLFTMRGAASMFSIAAVALSSPKGESTADDHRRFHAVLSELLKAARAGGFPDGHADELDALMLAGKVNGRSVALAHEAARCAGSDCCMAVANRHGI